MPSALSHDPQITVPGASTDNAVVIFDGTGGTGFGNSTILVDSGGNGRIGIATDTNLITLTNETVAVAGAITGVTALTVDNININGNTISSTAGTDLLITPLGGQQLILDGLIVIDNGVVTGATSITSTEFVGGGVGLTALNGTQVTSGTLPAARIAADSIVEGKLNVSNGPTNGYVLTARDGVAGGFTWEAAAGGGDLSFGGDTFGAEKIIGSNDAYSLSFETDGVVRMRIDGAAGSYTGAGAITMPTQPCFCVQNDNTDSNIGTSAHLVAWDTERFALGGDFNVSTEEFIAPTTGKYILNVMLQFTGIATNVTNISVRLDTSNLNYQADSESRDFQDGEYFF